VQRIWKWFLELAVASRLMAMHPVPTALPMQHERPLITLYIFEIVAVKHGI
jgi:hypothetical protein